MAKDGTARGGPRFGQGRPKKALADNVLDTPLPYPDYFGDGGFHQ